MMMAVAGTGGVVAPLAYEKKRPIARGQWLLVGSAMLLLHGAVGAWLLYQRFEMPAADRVDTPDNAPIIFMERLPEIEEPVVTEEPPAPPIAVHRPTTVAPSDVETSPIPVPDTPPSDQTIGGPVNLDPVPDTPTHGAATEPTLPPVSVINNPRWVRQPSAAQMERAYPRAAAADGTSGRAVLSCSVLADGSVSGCSVTSETPAGEGFGQAAVSLSRYFRLSPRTVDGRAVEGARVSIPLNFAIG